MVAGLQRDEDSSWQRREVPVPRTLNVSDPVPFDMAVLNPNQRAVWQVNISAHTVTTDESTTPPSRTWLLTGARCACTQT